jgi:hypothetical protein
MVRFLQMIWCALFHRHDVIATTSVGDIHHCSQCSSGDE